MYFAYAGPVVAVITWNALASAFAALCVYIFLRREKFKKKKWLVFITKPFHGIIKKIAQNKISKK